jgi:peptidoglycan/LPS O-acetylase OafA/YrhL
LWLLGYASNVRIGLAGLSPTRLSALPIEAWHFWSLAVEEQFYLVWPFVVWSTRPAQFVRLSVTLAAIALPVRVVLHAAVNPQAAYTFLPARMDALVIGGLVAVALRSPAWWEYVRARRGSVGVTAAVAAAAIGLFDLRAGAPAFSAVMQSVGYTAIAVATAAWVAYLVDVPDALGGRLSRGVLPAAGRYAYGLYVWHPIVVAVALPALAQRGWIGPDPAQRALWGTFGHLGAGMALSVLAAVASYHLYEAPFLRLKRLFPTRGEAPRASRSADDTQALVSSPS